MRLLCVWSCLATHPQWTIVWHVMTILFHFTMVIYDMWSALSCILQSWKYIIYYSALMSCSCTWTCDVFSSSWLDPMENNWMRLCCFANIYFIQRSYMHDMCTTVVSLYINCHWKSLFKNFLVIRLCFPPSLKCFLLTRFKRDSLFSLWSWQNVYSILLSVTR